MSQPDLCADQEIQMNYFMTNFNLINKRQKIPWYMT